MYQVPSNPPSFNATSRTPFSIDVDWGETRGQSSSNTTQQQGQGHSYYVYYRPLKGINRNWTVFGTKDTTARLNDLVPGSLYGIRVAIATVGSNGVASAEQDVWTIEGGEIILMKNLFHNLY